MEKPVEVRCCTEGCENILYLIRPPESREGGEDGDSVVVQIEKLLALGHIVEEGGVLKGNPCNPCSFAEIKLARREGREPVLAARRGGLSDG